MYIRPPKFIRRLFPSLIWSMPESDRVYLTFDDGPTPGVTEWILDQLAEYDAKATFFCLGKNAEQYPHLYRMHRGRRDTPSVTIPTVTRKVGA